MNRYKAAIAIGICSVLGLSAVRSAGRPTKVESSLGPDVPTTWDDGVATLEIPLANPVGYQPGATNPGDRQ
jgi:hypothetical protein